MAVPVGEEPAGADPHEGAWQFVDQEAPDEFEAWLLGLCRIWYNELVSARDKPLVWLHGEVKTPPFSVAARIDAGVLLRRLQRGEKLSMPHSRPMPSIGSRCHELRIQDAGHTWRIFYRLERDAVVIAGVAKKKTQRTPKAILEACRRRLARYDEDMEESKT